MALEEATTPGLSSGWLMPGFCPPTHLPPLPHHVKNLMTLSLSTAHEWEELLLRTVTKIQRGHVYESIRHSAWHVLDTQKMWNFTKMQSC